MLKQASKETAGKAILLSGIAVSVGFGLGPALACLIIEYLHLMPLRAPFWLLTILLLLSARVGLETLQDEDFQARKERRRAASALISFEVSTDIKPHFWSFSALPIFTLFTLNGTVLSLIPSFVKNVIHTSNLAVSGLLSYLFDLYVSLIVLNVLASLVVLYMLGYSVRFARYYAARDGTQAQEEGLPSKAGSQAV